MRNHLIVLIVLSVPCWGKTQTAPTGKAQTTGYCSPAVTGSLNRFTITCQGIPNKLRNQLVDLLNRIAKNQADFEGIMNKLDACIEGTQQVREQQTPWRLTDDQKGQLRKSLSGTKAKFAIYALPSDNNSTLLGGDILEVLQSAGWDSGGRSIYYYLGGIPPPDQVGLELLVDPQNIPGINLFPAAHQLLSGLNKIGIQTRWTSENIQAFVKGAQFKDNNLGNLIVIAVGAKPSVAAQP